MYVLEQQIEREQFPPEQEAKLLWRSSRSFLAPPFVEFIGKEIQTAYLESLFGVWPEHLRPLRGCSRTCWIQDQEFRDPETGEIFDRSAR